jgi:hypothetical protein
MSGSLAVVAVLGFFCPASNHATRSGPIGTAAFLVVGVVGTATHRPTPLAESYAWHGTNVAEKSCTSSHPTWKPRHARRTDSSTDAVVFYCLALSLYSYVSRFQHQAVTTASPEA